MAGAGREHAVVEEKIDARLRDQNGELLQELDWGEDEGAGAVGPRMRERKADAPVGEELDPLLRERRAQKIVAQALEPRAVVGAHRAPGVEIEARVAGVPRRLGFGRIRVRVVPDARDARVRYAAEDAAPGNRRGAERRERRRVLGERVARIGVRRAECEAAARQEAFGAARDRGDEARELARGWRRRGDEAPV